MSDSVGMWVRADWRRRYISLVALALVAGLSFAVAVTAFAGARRTASSFDRLREETRAYDHGVVVDAPGASPTGDDSYDDATIERIRQLPQIESSGGLVIYIASIPGADSEMALNVPEDDTLGTRIAADRVLRGRMPAVDRVDEVAVNEVAVQQTGVDVGSVLTLETLSPGQQQQLLAGDPSTFDHGPLGPQLQLRVVGVLRGPSDVMGRSDPTVYGTPAFDREYRGQVAYAYRILVVRRADGYTGAEFDDAVGSVLSGFRLGMFDAELENKPAERTTRTLAVGLAVFALIAGLVSILVVNQAVTRHVNGADADHPALSALGFTRPQRLWGLVAMVAPATIGAALVTTVASNAGSALMPVGLARRIEPEPGLRFDALATALGAGVLIATMLLTATIAAMSATRRQGVSETTSKQPSRIAVALSALGLGPVSANRHPARVRSSITCAAGALDDDRRRRRARRARRVVDVLGQPRPAGGQPGAMGVRVGPHARLHRDRGRGIHDDARARPGDRRREPAAGQLHLHERRRPRGRRPRLWNGGSQRRGRLRAWSPARSPTVPTKSSSGPR